MKTKRLKSQQQKIENVSTDIPAPIIRTTPSVKRQRAPVIQNNHPENETVFPRLPVRPGQSTYNEVVKPINSPDAIIITDSLANGIRETELNRNLLVRNSLIRVRIRG